MSDIKSTDIRLLDEALGMSSGYVLDFSDRTMSIFFDEELNIDIDDQRYQKDGTSKAKRLRCFLRIVDNATAARTIRALWDYKQNFCVKTASVDAAKGRLLALIARLESEAKANPSANPQPISNTALIAKLRTDLLAIWPLPPQQRGYAFERFLKGAFDLYGMSARGSFRLCGEQIDGSFELGHETYLVEAKWTATPIGAEAIHVLDGKLRQKAAWARGLFISYNGFTPDGQFAYGRTDRTICMSGQDFDEMLMQDLRLDEVIRAKVRRAAETGNSFIPVRDLSF